jgi:hypothetical protein
MKLDLRKVKHLMSIYTYRYKCEYSPKIIREYNLCKLLGVKCKELDVFIGVKFGTKEHYDRMSIFNFFYKMGKNDEEIKDIWVNERQERSKIKSELNLDYMPKSRRDNQNPKTNTVNGSGGSNKNKIRIPSRKHKNRFKNFMKLFPEYCERNGIEL